MRGAIVLMVVCAGLAGQAEAGGLWPEFKNTIANDTRTQMFRSHAVTASSPVTGETLAVWEEHPLSNNNFRIVGRFYSAAGVPVGNQFIISAVPGGRMMMPDVVSGGMSGDFYIVWSGGDGNIYGKIIDNFGNVLTDTIQVNTSNTGIYKLLGSDVAVNAVGEMVVAWDQIDAGNQRNRYVRRFNASGWPVGLPVRMNQLANWSDKTGLCDIDINLSGDVIVAWGGVVDNYSSNVAWRTFNIYDPASTWGVVPETPVPSPANGFFHNRPSVDINDNGDIVIAWAVKDDFGSPYTVMAQRYSGTDGLWLGPIDIDPNKKAFRVVGYVDDNGSMIFSWARKNGIKLQVFDSQLLPASRVETVSASGTRPSISVRQVDARKRAIRISGELKSNPGVDIYLSGYSLVQ